MDSKDSQVGITDEKRQEYRSIDPFWGTQMHCAVCDRCSCEACHADGPCVPSNSDEMPQSN